MNKYQLATTPNVHYIPIERGIVSYVPTDIDLYLWSDQHFGANECNYELAENILEDIKTNPKARVILGGDTLEAIPRGYKISERGQRVTPDEQIIETGNRLKCIAKKVLVLFKGNHNTEMRGESVDSDMVLAAMLGVPYKTVPTVIQLKTKKGTIKIAGGHGKSGAKNGDLELDQLRKIFPGCVIYFLGHNHMLYAKKSGALVYDEEGKEHWEGAWYTRTGNCLNYAEYARYGLMTPQESGCIRYEIRGGKVKDAIRITEEYFKG